MKPETLQYLVGLDSVILCLLALATLRKLICFQRVHTKQRIRHFDIKQVVLVLLTSLASTYLLSMITSSLMTNTIIFLLFMCLIPYVMLNERKRLTKEECFDDVVLYCQNTSMLLKQNHNVYQSLTSVKNDLSTPLRKDVEQLLVSLDDSQSSSLDQMRQMEIKYPYSCINNLNILLLTVQFEHSNIDDSLLFNYQQELDELQKDIRDNKQKRKTLRLQYIGITVGCLISYWFFLTQMGHALGNPYDDSFYNLLNFIYILLNMILLFGVDTYFNSSITKE